MEIEGVLNPAAIRGPDGQLYLFPRLVGAGNFSRIGIARVQFNDAGDPCGVERLGIALDPVRTRSSRHRRGASDGRARFEGPDRTSPEACHNSGTAWALPRNHPSVTFVGGA